MISVDLTPEQKSRVQMAQVIRRATHSSWRDHLDIWRDCRDESIIAGRWEGTLIGTLQTSRDLDTLLDTLIGPYEGEAAEQFLQAFQSNYPALVQFKEFCEANIAGFEVDLERFYCGNHIAGVYTTTSEKVKARITIEVLNDGSSRVLIRASQPHNTHRDWGSVAYFRDMQEIINVVMILVIQAKVMGLEVIEE